MKKENIDKLLKKYEAGESSLAEEEFISDHAKETQTEYKPWLTLMQQKKQKAPVELKDRIWNAIEVKQKKKKRLTIALMSAAATVLLVFSIIVFNPGKKKLSYQDKEALLSEALGMFDRDATLPIYTAQNVLYEDDMIIIYTTPE